MKRLILVIMILLTLTGCSTKQKTDLQLINVKSNGVEFVLAVYTDEDGKIFYRALYDPDDPSSTGVNNYPLQWTEITVDE